MPDFSESNDFLIGSNAFRYAYPARDFFRWDDQRHVDSLKIFLQTGNWGQVQFFCESPYTDVPTTVLMRFAEGELNARRETRVETQIRLAAKTLTVPAKDPIVQAP